MVFCFFSPMLIFIYLFGHLVFYLFGPLDLVYQTSFKFIRHVLSKALLLFTICQSILHHIVFHCMHQQHTTPHTAVYTAHPCSFQQKRCVTISTMCGVQLPLQHFWQQRLKNGIHHPTYKNHIYYVMFSQNCQKCCSGLLHPTLSRHNGTPTLSKVWVCSIYCCVWGGVLLHHL